jgi:hypothetical protein
MVTALFVMMLLTGLGMALLFLGQIEMKMSRADANTKATFYLAEGGLEAARESFRLAMLGGSSIGAELAAGAGGDGEIDFDPATVRPVYDTDGNVTGLTGFDDDVPFTDETPLGDGTYAAFITNDPLDGRQSLTDTNGRVMIVALAAGRSGSVEIVEGVLEQDSFPDLPAAITILGPDATFDGGNGIEKEFSGDDCYGLGVPGLNVPVVGTVDDVARDHARLGVFEPLTFHAGGANGVDTVETVGGPGGTINPLWLDCGYLLDLASKIKSRADIVGDASTPWADFGTPSDPKIVFIEDDYIVNGGTGAGLLWVTGELEVYASLDWSGVIVAGGRGLYKRHDEATATIDGAFLVANMAGPDGLLWTLDDCSGPDGVAGNSDDGYDQGQWIVADPGDGSLSYCESSVALAQERFPYSVVEFRQR